jgi:hypothetical protein
MIVVNYLCPSVITIVRGVCDLGAPSRSRECGISSSCTCPVVPRRARHRIFRVFVLFCCACVLENNDGGSK